MSENVAANSSVADVGAHVDTEQVAALMQNNPAAAAQLLRETAHAGYAIAQALYAQLLLDGNGVERDAEAALHLFQLAAHAGHVMAMNMFGRCCELGWGRRVDFELAAVWYRRAAEHGLDWAMYNLAHLYVAGTGVLQDRAHAYRLYRHAADLGHAKSMGIVGRYYENGWEVEADMSTAFDWYRKSAEGGDFRGQCSYASMLAEQGEVERAAGWLRLAIQTAIPSFARKLASTLSASPQPVFRQIAQEILVRHEKKPVTN